MLELDKALLAFHGPTWEHFTPTIKQEERAKMAKALGVIADFQEMATIDEDYETLKAAIRRHLGSYLEESAQQWDELGCLVRAVGAAGQQLNVIPKEMR